MTNFFVSMLGCLLFMSTTFSFAQENVSANENTQIESTIVESTQTQDAPSSVEKMPQVGKHVMANTNASSMILSLLMVLGVIVISALVLKRFNLTQQSSNQLKVIGSLSLGAKERVVVVQVGEQQLVLGVCSQQVTLLKDLDTPLEVQSGKALALSGNVLSFLQNNTTSKKSNSNTATNETTSNT
jgi:flagellar protein FliO/FliZ